MYTKLKSKGVRTMKSRNYLYAEDLNRLAEQLPVRSIKAISTYLDKKSDAYFLTSVVDTALITCKKIMQALQCLNDNLLHEPCAMMRVVENTKTPYVVVRALGVLGTGWNFKLVKGKKVLALTPEGKRSIDAWTRVFDQASDEHKSLKYYLEVLSKCDVIRAEQPSYVTLDVTGVSAADIKATKTIFRYLNIEFEWFKTAAEITFFEPHKLNALQLLCMMQPADAVPPTENVVETSLVKGRCEACKYYATNNEEHYCKRKCTVKFNEGGKSCKLFKKVEGLLCSEY